MVSAEQFDEVRSALAAAQEQLRLAAAEPAAENGKRPSDAGACCLLGGVAASRPMTAPGFASEHVGAEQLAAAEAGQAAAEAAAAVERQQRQALEATNAELHQAVATAEDTAAAGRAAAASAAAAAASAAAGMQAQVVDLQR